MKEELLAPRHLKPHFPAIMKFLSLLLVFASCVSLPLHADQAPAVEKIVSLLREAEKSETPLPLLEKAQARLKDYKPAPSVSNRRPRAKGAIKAESKDRKQEAMEKLNDAIALAKEGKNARLKIHATISCVVHMGDMKD